MNWLRQLFSRKQLYHDLSGEIQEHIDEKAEELMQNGLSREEALAAARREFGNTALMEEHGREVWQWAWLENLLRDLRFALRQLRRTPGFTLTVVLILALAIGANTTIFSMVSALLLRPLPYPQPERLAAVTVRVAGIAPDGKTVDSSGTSVDGETWEMARDNLTAAQPAVYSWGASGVNLQAGSQVRYVQQERISAHYFEVLGIQPLLGRSFTAEEDRPNGPKVVILSFETWQSVFSSDRQIIGQSIRLKGEPYTVVGVMPPGTKSADPTDLWTPLRPQRQGEGEGTNYHVVMRLRDNVSWAEVNNQLQALHPSTFDRLEKQNPGLTKRLSAQPLQKYLAAGKSTPAMILMSAVGLILLIASANLAGLMLVRFTRRGSEVATRMALGASRAAIFRQVMVEPLLLTVAGAACGMTAAYLGLNSFVTLFPADMIPLGGVSLDGRVLAFAALTTALASLMIGIFPALAIRHVQIRPSLAGRTSSSLHSGRTRQYLITAEVSLTLVLLAGAGLLIRTLVYLQSLPPGFDSNHVTTARVSLDDVRYHDPDVFQKLLRDSVAAMQQIPGVESAAVGLSLPIERGLNSGFKIKDGPTAGTSLSSSNAYVTPDYFRALHIPILAGRAFTDSDTKDGVRVALVNVSFAKTFMGTLDVVGRQVELGRTQCIIVGVTGDVKKRPGINAQAPLSTEPVYYVPATQMSPGFLALAHTWFQPSWIVRTHGPVVGVPEAMQKALAQADPNLPFVSFRSLDDLQATALSQQRIEVLLLTVLAGLALLLSVVGIYGLVSNLVVQRTQEIGIRMALGATVSQAMSTVGRAGLIAVAYGIAAGLALAGLTLGILKSELYGVRNYDPVTLIAVLALLALTALVASFVPTLRIARIDPASTLRAE
ncbi:MAG TPA: ABC transporter permease [Alphaproteobacteria bacterium]|nr:ABC transporter permease [Alphaproteobacteria bacterium]